ncbi:methyltransferase domain-containing protein [Phlyctochytrium arcticum]|nr:methyltransferase domain-containing protein [Phlyctochytrium arcticum]
MSLPRDSSSETIVKNIANTAKALDNKVTYGMTPKKKHEVQIMAAFIDNVAARNQISHVMDLGAGQGYLDAVLAYTYGHTVIGVDDDTVQTCGAKRRSDLIQKLFSRPKNSSASIGKVFHLNRRITAADAFTDILTDVGAENMEKSQDKDSSMATGKRWLLCGLHSCGDLSPAMMKHFLQSDAQALVCVGCCYNHLSENGPDPFAPPRRAHESGPHIDQCGFPLSQHLTQKGSHLGITARMLACQATCRWMLEQQASIDAFSKHYYRALLQQLIVDFDLLPDTKDSRDIIVGRLGRGAFRKGFPTYAYAALEKLHINPSAHGITDKILEDYELRYNNRQMEVAIVWTLRAMMAEAIESLILMDRYISLLEAASEQPMSVKLLPLFDHVESPRNMVLVAEKRI